MNPDDEGRRIEMDDNPWEVEQLKDEIFKMQSLEKELKEKITDVVNVSFFQIQCKEIKAYLCEKYYMMSKILIDMIAKKAKSMTQGVFGQFQAMQNKLRE